MGVSAALAPYVDRIWSWEGRAEELPTVFPGTGAELVIQRGAGIVAHTASGPYRLPEAHLLCLRRTRWRLAAAGPVAFTAVRLRAGALAALCPVPTTVIADQAVAAADVFGAAADRLVAAVRAGGTLAERAARIESVLVRTLDSAAPPDRRVAAAVARIYRDPATARVNQIGPGVGLSARHLRRGFLTTVGVPPKEFQQLARFQRVVRTLLLSESQAHLAVALSAGYYDQSHYIKDVRRLTGARPTELLAGSVPHFYYPSLSRRGGSPFE
ncbi:hypothetical protein GCM10020216_065550 [Nonomuraea helvata]